MRVFPCQRDLPAAQQVALTLRTWYLLPVTLSLYLQPVAAPRGKIATQLATWYPPLLHVTDQRSAHAGW